jgi:hypothetical protein
LSRKRTEEKRREEKRSEEQGRRAGRKEGKRAIEERFIRFYRVDLSRFELIWSGLSGVEWSGVS